jgi:hypothetical protein
MLPVLQMAIIGVQRCSWTKHWGAERLLKRWLGRSVIALLEPIGNIPPAEATMLNG